MYGKIKEHLQNELAEIKAAGLYKRCKEGYGRARFRYVISTFHLRLPGYAQAVGEGYC